MTKQTSVERVLITSAHKTLENNKMRNKMKKMTDFDSVYKHLNVWQHQKTNTIGRQSLIIYHTKLKKRVIHSLILSVYHFFTSLLSNWSIFFCHCSVWGNSNQMHEFPYSLWAATRTKAEMRGSLRFGVQLIFLSKPNWKDPGLRMSFLLFEAL